MMMSRTRALLAMALLVGCGPTSSGEPDVPGELGVIPVVGGKTDSAVTTLIPEMVYSTQVWEVENQWEDRWTEAAAAAGLAWGEDSGLSWDEKYARWVQSLEAIPPHSGFGTTFELTTPFGKSLPAPKLDCADVSILLRASFAAWYHLPFSIVAYDGGQAVYLGHFGIRTASGTWNNMPQFASAYDDFSDLDTSIYEADWPRDEGLREKGVIDGDEVPFLGEGARTGAYLDEIHLNKRAGRFIRLLLIFTGSIHLADSHNTFNLAPEALRAGDTNLWRWQALGYGHTMVTIRVDSSVPGVLEAQSVFGNIPPQQPRWDGPVVTRLNYTDARAGGEDDDTDYAPLGGGLKRWRVAKLIGGVWQNGIMDADAGKWINSSDLDAIRARPETLEGLLGDPTPEEKRDALLATIESKRQHLRNYPASCAARTAREKGFTALYDLMAEEFSMDQLEVDQEFRIVEDYVFAELSYGESMTCCWNSTTPAMFDTVMDHDAVTRGGATECTEPMVFKARNADYEIYRDHNPVGWVEWSADEPCPWAPNVVDDVELPLKASPFCEVFGDE